MMMLALCIVAMVVFVFLALSGRGTGAAEKRLQRLADDAGKSEPETASKTLIEESGPGGLLARLVDRAFPAGRLAPHLMRTAPGGLSQRLPPPRSRPGAWAVWWPRPKA